MLSLAPYQRSLAAIATVVSCLLVSGRFCRAENAELESASAGADVNQILATVDGVPIQLGEVRQELSAVLSDRRPEAADAQQLVREMLQQIIRRRLAFAALLADRRAANEQLVQRAVDAHREGFQQRGESLDEFLRQNGVRSESFEQRIRWELSWAAYKDEMLTDANLRTFFERYRRHFDGTEVRASHILLRSKEHATGGRGQGTGDEGAESETSAVPSSKSSLPMATSAALDRAREIRASIVTGELTFAEAARKFSDAPSKDRGGDIGYFPRRGVMHEAFAATAFGLEPNAISSPVVTPFGVHLIQVTGEKPGSKEFSDVRDEVYRAAETRLFEALVARGRKRAKVEFSAD